MALLKLDDRILIDSIPYAFRREQGDVGQRVYVLGYPRPTEMGTEIKLTDGLISSKSGFDGKINLYQISAPVQPGNSGGPVLDANGNIIAVINAKIPGADNVSYCIKSKYLFDLIESSDVKIPMKSRSQVSGKPLVDQIQAYSKCVYLIHVK